MKRIITVVAILLCYVNLYAQTIDDIGKIVIGVRIPSTANDDTKSCGTYLRNKLVNLAASAGLSSYGDNAFFLSPSISINNIQIAEGGMKNVYAIDGEIYLTIQENKSGIVYESTSLAIKGYGTSKENAVKNGLQKLSYDNIERFFELAKKRILNYYNSMQEKIFANADMLSTNREYDAAIACLMTIPEELFDVYQKAFAKACDIYRERDLFLKEQNANRIKEANDAILVKARCLISAHDARGTLKALWDYTITETEQDKEYHTIMNTAQERISNEERTALENEKREYEEKKRIEERDYQDRKIREERAYADSRQEYSDNIQYRNKLLELDEKEIDNKRATQSEITNSIKSIALAYIQKSKRL